MLGMSAVYPSASHPEFGTFAEALFETIASCGVDVQALAPYSRTRALFDMLKGRSKMESRTAEQTYAVHRPGYWSASTRLLPWGSAAMKMTAANLRKAVMNGFPWGIGGIDFVHTYFFDAGRACLDVCEKHGIPCFVELGESGFSNYVRELGDEEFNRCLMRFSGLVAVSKDNEAYVRSRCPGIGERLIHLPNSVDTSIFKPHNRVEARKRLNLPESERLVVFCGHFVERKGPLRVKQSLEIAGDTKGIFVGTGPQVPQGNQVVHAGAVENSSVPLWLSAGDVFVLPRLAEGMCVAIIEALACGLPVVVSDRPFNRSFLTEECAVFVDPENPHSIAAGIKYAMEDPDRYQKMSASALQLSHNYSLKNRTRSLLEFVAGRIGFTG